MIKISMILGILASSLAYTYTMISYLDALTPLSLINILLSSLLWPIAVASMISMIRSKTVLFLSGFLLLIIQSTLILVTKFYHDYFLDLPHLEMLLHQASEGTEVLGMVFKQIMKGFDWLILACALFGAIMIPLKTPNGIPFRKAIKPLLSTILILATLWSFVLIRKKDFNDRGIHYVRYGLIATATAQTWDIFRPKRTVKPTKPILTETDGSIPDEIKKLNVDHVFILQLESLDPDLVGQSENGVPVAPFLSKIKNDCTYFKNFYSQHGGGGSSDAELASLSGLYALPSHGGLSTANHDWLVSLPERLAENSIDSYFFHSNSPTFYDRGRNLKKLGFKRSFFSGDFSTKNRGFSASDAEFFKESLTLLEKENPKRFLAYLVTIQSHGPFNRHKLPNPFPENIENLVKNDYIRAIYELDDAVKTFFDALKKSPWNQNTAVILYSDHLSSVYQAKENGRERIFSAICGIGKIDSISSNLGSHTDITPTVTDLFGVKSYSGWVGNSLIRNVKDRYTFLVRPPFVIQNGDEPPSLMTEATDKNQLVEYSQTILWP